MSSPPGVIKASWSSPAGWLVKGIITIYYRMGHRQDASIGKQSIRRCLERHISRADLFEIIGVDVTDNAIQQRGHKGTFRKNEFEHPDKHELGRKFWPYAQGIVEKQKLLSLSDIDAIVDHVMNPNKIKPRIRVKAIGVYV